VYGTPHKMGYTSARSVDGCLTRNVPTGSRIGAGQGDGRLFTNKIPTYAQSFGGLLHPTVEIFPGVPQDKV